MIELEKLIDAQDQTVKQIQEKMDLIHGPVWAARGDLAKILITLNSAILGAVIAFSKDVFEGATEAQAELVIVALWGLIISLVCSLLTISSKIDIEGIHARYFNQRQQIHTKSRNVDLDADDANEQLDSIFKDAIDAALAPAGSADKVAHISSYLSMSVFVVSLILFLASLGSRYV